MRTCALRGRCGGRDGFATLVVLALVVLMVVFVVSTQKTLSHVKREIRRIEVRQETRQRQIAPASTAPVAAAGEAVAR